MPASLIVSFPLLIVPPLTRENKRATVQGDPVLAVGESKMNYVTRVNPDHVAGDCGGSRGYNDGQLGSLA